MSTASAPAGAIPVAPDAPVDLLDVSFLHLLMGGDPILTSEILTSFRDDVGRLCADLVVQLEDGADEVLGSIGHNLAGLAANLRSRRIEHLARQLMAAAASGDRLRCRDLSTDLASASCELRANILA